MTSNTAKLLNTTETAELLGVKPNTLENWRLRGVGPKFLKIGKLVKYRESSVEDYLDEQTRQSTSEGA